MQGRATRSNRAERDLLPARTSGLVVPIGEHIAEDDLVASEGTMTGTPEDVFKGVESTHAAIENPEASGTRDGGSKRVDNQERPCWPSVTWFYRLPLIHLHAYLSQYPLFDSAAQPYRFMPPVITV